MSNPLDKLRDLYSPDQGWALFRELRSATGSQEGLRIADAVAVSIWPSKGFEVHGLEVKTSRADFLRELRSPTKAREIGRFCSRFYLVTPAPWKKVLLSTEELPEGWGLIEDGRIVREATEREAVEPTTAFLQSLLRAGARGSEEQVADAPLVRITRPHLDRHRVGLACGHTAPAPGAKKMPVSVPCFSCAEGRPADLEVVRAFLEEADPATVATIATDVNERLGGALDWRGT